MILENKYLKKAIQKAGYVIMVKRCSRRSRSSKLDYISSNASELGMNVELLNKGLKLTEDYIHPEDRKLVIQTMLSAVDSKLNDYVHEYRMVGDDGTVYNVTNEICVSEVNEDTFSVEFYLRNSDKIRTKSDISANGNIVRKTISLEKMNPADYEGDFGSKENSKVYSTMNTFAKVTNLYSVLVDFDGKIVFPPTGPATNIGDFYDLFEKPAYKEYYKYIKQYVMDKGVPVVLDREEGGIGKISPAPIKAGDRIMGFWILGSYTEEETAKLNELYESQWEIAGLISDSLWQRKVISDEVAKSRGAGIKLREELDRQNIINEALTKTGSQLSNQVDEVIEETIKAASVNLNADKSFLYIVKSSYHKHNTLRSYWESSGGAPDNSITIDLPDHIPAIERVIEENGLYIADGANITEKAKLATLRHGFKAFVCVPLYKGKEIYGILFFADCKATRVWAADELRFMKSIALVLMRMLDDAEGNEIARRVNKQLIETYNSFKSGVFVRDAYTGKVLFSNTAMNDMVGYDFVGNDSREIITDLHDRFDNIDGMRKPFITKNKITNWRRYIEALGGIMDISEIQIDWITGDPASLLIVRAAKDF